MFFPHQDLYHLVWLFTKFVIESNDNANLNAILIGNYLNKLSKSSLIVK